MRRRLVGAILLLYPRRVRKGHGQEIVALIDELITHDGRSRAGLFARLAVDGLAQRIARTATAWTAAAVVGTTSLGGLAVADFAAASAHRDPPRRVTAVAPGRHAYRTPATRRDHAHTSRDPAQKIARQSNSIRPAHSGDASRSNRGERLAR
jgi:hypothetical protein